MTEEGNEYSGFEELGNDSQGSEVSRLKEAIRVAEKLGSAACVYYCRWYETGDSNDGSSVAYELVTWIRQMLSVLDCLEMEEAMTEPTLDELREWLDGQILAWDNRANLTTLQPPLQRARNVLSALRALVAEKAQKEKP